MRPRIRGYSASRGESVYAPAFAVKPILIISPEYYLVTEARGGFWAQNVQWDCKVCCMIIATASVQKHLAYNITPKRGYDFWSASVDLFAKLCTEQ